MPFQLTRRSRQCSRASVMECFFTVPSESARIDKFQLIMQLCLVLIRVIKVINCSNHLNKKGEMFLPGGLCACICGTCFFTPCLFIRAPTTFNLDTSKWKTCRLSVLSSLRDEPLIFFFCYCSVAAAVLSLSDVI